MNLTPLSNEEIEAIRSAAPWVKILGSGMTLTIIIGLWKVFGLYKRLEDVEKGLNCLTQSNLLTYTRHEELTDRCRVTVDAKIDKAISELHMKWLEEMRKVSADMSEIKETQCHVLGELKQLINALDK